MKVKKNMNTSSKVHLAKYLKEENVKFSSLKNGNFNSIDDIKNVDGIGDSLFEKIKMYIKV
mgnify:CR=1 FL=1